MKRVTNLKAIIPYSDQKSPKSENAWGARLREKKKKGNVPSSGAIRERVRLGKKSTCDQS